MKIKQFFKCLIISILLPLSGCNNTRFSNALIINKQPDKVVYNVNEMFTTDGLVVVDKDGVEVEDYDCSISRGTILKKEGIRKVELTKEDYKPVSFKIEIKKMPVLKVAQMPNKTLYKLGEYFTVDGLIITSDGGEEVKDYNLSYRVGDAFTSIGEKTINVTKEGYSATSFKVVVEKDLELVINHLPNKTTYKVGDAFDSTGLSVGDNKGKTNLAYTLSIKDGDILKYSGTIPVEVRVEGYASISFDIKVEKNSGGQTGNDKTINVYYVNDTHGSFIRNTEDGEAGMAYISSYLKDKKANEDENAIILSGGDMFQGGVESNDTRGHIMVDAMNNIGFDAMTLGNHEFDWGEDKIISNQEMMDFPLLSCNTFYANDRTTRPDWLEPFTVIERDGLKIGIVGYARGDMGSSIDAQYGSDFYFPSPFNYIKEYSRTLRLSYNCDLILSVGHDEGLNNGDDGYGTSYYDLTQIDTQTGARYVDGMMFAHDHYKKQGYCNEVPYMETGCNGENIGHMTFELTSEDGISYSATGTVEVLNAVNNCRTEDKEITDLVEKYKDEFLADPDSVLRTFDQSYSKNQFTLIICQAMVWFVNDNPDLFDNKTVYIASHNTGGVRVDYIPQGDFTYRDLIKTTPFDNPLCLEKCNSRNVSRIRSSSNPSWQLCEPVYTGGYTNCVTISYIAGKTSNSSQYTSYKQYDDYTAKLALIRFLQSNEAIDI